MLRADDLVVQIQRYRHGAHVAAFPRPLLGMVATGLGRTDHVGPAIHALVLHQVPVPHGLDDDIHQVGRQVQFRSQ